MLCLSITLSLGACKLLPDNTPDEGTGDATPPSGETPEEKPEHTHEWTDADCVAPKTCSICGATEGEALGHSMNDATCTLPATCSVCGETEGEANGHSPAEDDYDCTTPVECTVCGGDVIAAAEHLDENNDGKCDSEGCNHVFFVPIYTTDDLVSAFKSGGVFKLMNDLDTGDAATSIGGTSVSLDLGGFTLTTSYWIGLNVSGGANLRLSNGTVSKGLSTGAALVSYGETHISNCTLEGGGYWSLYVNGGTTTVENSTIKYGIAAYGDENDIATVIAIDNVTVADVDPLWGIGIDADEYGTITIGFDPTSILGCMSQNAKVTDNGDGTWTVVVPPHTHSMNDATCTLPATCSVCGETEGEALGHSMNAATCDLPATCSVCGETEGDPLGHSYVAVVTDPTCSSGGYCTYTCENDADHNYVDDETPATGIHVYENGFCKYGCGMMQVYVINSEKWGEVAAYAWGGSQSVEWPGNLLNKSGDTVNGFDVYLIETDAPNIIFNNNGNGTQTADLITAAGQYFDLREGVWYATLADVPEIDPLSTRVYITGAFNSWDAYQYEFRYNEESDAIAYVSVELAADSSYEFKIVDNGVWKGTQTSVSRESGSMVFLSSVAENAVIHTDAAGVYIFSYRISDSTFSVEYPHVHSYSDATCLLPATCTGCGLTEGEALGHSIEGATCTTAGTCSVCGETAGDPLGHSCDFKGICTVCGENNAQELKIGESIDLDFSTNTTAYFYINTEIGKLYQLDKSQPTCYFNFDVYNASGEKVVSNSYFTQFKADEDVYYFVATERYTQIYKTTLSLSYRENPYEAEGVEVHDIEVGKALTATVKDGSVWVKVDNTTGRYDGFVFLCSELTGSGNHYYYEGIKHSGWSTGSSYSLISPMEVDVRQVIYFCFEFKAEDGTEVTINLVKPVIISTLGRAYTITTDNLTEDGRIAVMKSWGDNLTYEVKTDLGKIETVVESGGTYIGEADGVEYIKSTSVFTIEFIVKVDNPDGSLTLTEHKTHTDQGDGSCICGTAVE